MLARLEKKAAHAARKTGFAFGGALFFLIGLAFLTVAAWIYLALTLSTLHAALIIGAAYVGFGLIFFGLAQSGDTPEFEQPRMAAQTAPKAETGSAPPLMEAFLFGMQAGMGAQKRS